MRLVAIGLGVLAAVGLVVSLFLLREIGDRSDRIDELNQDLDAATGESGEARAEIERAESDSAAFASRWLAAVAVSGDHSPFQSRLLAVEANTRSQTPEATAALGHVLFADARARPPIVELEHDGPVWVTDAASSAEVVATGSDDTTTKLWSPAGDLLATLGHPGRLRALDFSADDQTVAAGSSDGTVTAWTATGEEITTVEHTDQVNDVGLNADGTVMVSAGHDGTMLVTDLETGEVRRDPVDPDIVWSVALSADGTRVATGGDGGSAKVWDLDTGTEAASYDIGEPVTRVEFSPDDRLLFIGGQVGTAMLVDLDGGEPGSQLDGTFLGGVIDIDWHPDGTELAVVSLFGIHRYDLPAGTLIAQHKVAGGARGAAYGPDGRWLATGSGDFEFSFGAVTFWDTTSGKELAALNVAGPVETVSVHSSGTVLAGFRTTEDLVEVGGALLVPGPGHWISLACEGTDGVIGEELWSSLTGEQTSREIACP